MEMNEHRRRLNDINDLLASDLSPTDVAALIEEAKRITVTLSDLAEGETDQLPVAVDVTEGGRYKYALVRAEIRQADGTSTSRYFVRGGPGCNYHYMAAEQVTPVLDTFKNCVEVEVMGGGRIEWSFEGEHDRLHVYGYSYQFGQPDHSITCGLLQEAFPTWNVTWSDAGY